MAKASAYNRKKKLTWDDVCQDAIALGEKLRDHPSQNGRPWKGIIAIPRGGLFPAAIVSRVLNIHMIETFCMNSYDFQDQGDLTIFKEPQWDLLEDRDGDGYIVLDDLSDTGKTFEYVRNQLPKAHFACAYVKPRGKDQADTYVHEVEQDTYIYHPWEWAVLDGQS